MSSSNQLPADFDANRAVRMDNLKAPPIAQATVDESRLPPTGGQPSGEAVEQAYRESQQQTRRAWTDRTPKPEPQPERHAVRVLGWDLEGGLQLVAEQSEYGFRTLYLRHDDFWDWSQPRTVEQLADAAPALVLPILQRAVAHLERIVGAEPAPETTA